MGSIAQFVTPGASGEILTASIESLARASFWTAVLQVFLINMLLSGDNAVVIAMACQGLPRRQRVWGLVIGAGVAVILLIVFTGAVARLMLFPYLKLLGGLALFYIAAKLLVPERAGKDEVEAAAHLWRAVRIIIVADVVMSLDNIVAVAAVAKGNFVLLAIGLTVSIPLILAGAALITVLLDRFPILVWAGAALLGWVAGETIADDPAVLAYVTRAFGAKLAGPFESAAAGAGVVLVLAAGGLWRQRRRSKLGPQVPREHTADT